MFVKSIDIKKKSMYNAGKHIFAKQTIAKMLLRRVFMITTLQIKNVGIIEDLCIDFQKGLNVLTGETGA